jgi:hypothetical protein
MKTDLRSAARFAPIFALAAAALFAPVPGFAGTAEVSFVAPERFTDAAHRRGPSRQLDRNLAHLENHIAKLARSLPEGQILKVEVTDIDLAGWIEPSADPYDIRVLRDVHPPRIVLNYTLARDGAAPVSGRSALTDIAYLHRSAFGPADDSLRYEKRLLTEWFRKQIVNAAG